MMRNILIEKHERYAAENRAFTTFGPTKSERRILWALLRFRSRRDNRRHSSGEDARPGDTILSVTSKRVGSERGVNSYREGTWHVACDNIIGRAADRIAFRWGRRCRLDRSSAHRAVHSPARRRGRNRLYCDREPPRANGSRHLPASAGRSRRRGGCFPGCLPRPGVQGSVDPRSGPPGKLVVRGHPPHRSQSSTPDRPPARA